MLARTLPEKRRVQARHPKKGACKHDTRQKVRARTIPDKRCLHAPYPTKGACKHDTLRVSSGTGRRSVNQERRWYYWQVLELVGAVAEKARIAGIDMVELMPARDIDGQGVQLAAQFLVAALGVIARQRL